MQYLGACIVRCTTLRSHFEFQGLSLHLLPSSVWEQCGDKMQSLFIHGCDVDDDTIASVIVYCPNLIHLRLQSQNYHAVKQVLSDLG